MKSEIQKYTESELLENYPIKGKVDGWFFRTKETANNAWEVEGSDRWGRKIYLRGDDPDRNKGTGYIKLFDLGAISIDDDFTILGRNGKLKLDPVHEHLS